MMDRMDAIAKSNYTGKEKFHAYSGHDGTIAGKMVKVKVINIGRRKNSERPKNQENVSTIFEKCGDNLSPLWKIELPKLNFDNYLAKMAEIFPIAHYIYAKNWSL